MPARRDLGDGLGDELRDLYQGLERELAAGIARRLTPGIEAQDWAQRRLAAVGEVRRWATGLSERAAGRAGPAATRAVAQAFRRGSMEALRDLGRPERGGDLPGQRGIDRLAGALRGRLDGTAMPIARAAVDAYQRTVAQATANVLGGALTRRGAAERAWNGLLDQGFTAFTDVRGRRWAASGYVEMATRTATAQAAVQGHLDRLESLGLDLVIVSDSPQECKLCRPFEQKILTRKGPSGPQTIEAESELTGEPVTVHVLDSVAGAIAKGLMHNNCRHTLGAYLPGLTKVKTDTADPEGDKARQKLRYLEREQRRWKLREAGALDDKSRTAAKAKVKTRQAEIREHMKTNPKLTRRSDREQIDLSNRRVTGEPTPAPTPVPPPAPEPVRITHNARIDMRTPEQARVVTEELDRQAALAPNSMARLRSVRTGEPAELAAVDPNAAAFYNPMNREVVMNVDPFSPANAAAGRHACASGWWTRCPEELADRYTLAHELGHHVDMGNAGHWSKSAEHVKIWHALADELGVPRLAVRVNGRLHEVPGLTTFLSSHRAAIARLVSEYGATDRHEFLAEVWAEYSLAGDAARPFIKKIGALLRRIAESPEGKI